MTKKLTVLFLMLSIIFSALSFGSCQNKGKDSNKGKIKYDIVDYDNALVKASEGKYSNTYSADDKLHENKYVIPKINVDLPGANEISKKIMSDFNDRYEEHFKTIKKAKDGTVKKTDMYVNIDYSYSVQFDVVAIIIKRTEGIAGSGEHVYHDAYYYDALVDIELSAVEYIGYCSSNFNEVFRQLYNSDYALQYKEKTGKEVTEDNIAFAIYKKENQFDVYVKGWDKGQTDIVTVTVEKINYELPNIQID